MARNLTLPSLPPSHAIVSSTSGPEYYVSILSFVDKTQLEPGCTVLLHNKVMSVVGILSDEADPMVSVMKVREGVVEGKQRVMRSSGDWGHQKLQMLGFACLGLKPNLRATHVI